MFITLCYSMTLPRHRLIKTKSILTALLMLFSIQSRAQDYNKQRNELFAYNILTNGMISGVSSLFNKQPNEKAWRVFTTNFGKGCLGGLVKYTAKYQTFYFRQLSNVYFAPVNRAFFFIGHSMVMNASMNERLLSNYHCHFYGINFNYRARESKGDRLKARLSFSTMASIVSLTLRGDRIDLFKTLEYGQFYMDLNSYALTKIGGRALFNVISIGKTANGSFQSVVPHEIIHTYQTYDFFAVSSMYKTKQDQFFSKSKVYNAITHFIDLDYEPLFFSTLYLIQPEPKYYKNFFEFEAEHFSKRLFIDRN